MLRGRLIAIFAMLVVVVAVPASAQAKPGKRFGSRVLQRGSHGHDVRVLQRYLTRAGFRTSVDGRFGVGTYRTVRRWEGAIDRRVDGRVTRSDARALRTEVESGGAADAPATLAPVQTTPANPQLAAAGSGGADADGAAAFAAPTAKGVVNPDGTATAPADAPQVVKDIIAAGNEIAFKPYVYGGGHGRWQDKGYDCSGSVSYALHFAGLLKTSLDSTSFESWGDPGPGQWVTIYANAGHAYMVVAGLRFDTSAAKSGKGSRWTAQMRSPSGFVARHPTGL